VSRFMVSRTMACAACVCAAVLFAGSSAAKAAAFNIDDRAEDPAAIGIFANDFEYGLSIDGTLFQQGTHNPASGSVAGESFSFAGEWFDAGQSTPLTRTVYFVEPGMPNDISDILEYTVQTDGSHGHISGSFTSDSDPGNLGTVPAGTSPDDIWVEGSGDFYFGAAYLAGYVLTTPEPASLLLLGMAGLLLRRR
jgi:hypothetical protein